MSNHLWSIGQLGKYAYIKARIGWRGLSSDEYTDDGPYLIAGTHIQNGQVNWAACDHISMYRYEESMEIALQERDVVLTKDGTIGRVAILDKLPGKATINSTMMLVRSRPPLVPEYVFYYLSSEAFQRLVDERTSGSSIPHIFQRDLVELSIPIPPENEQKRIAEILNTADSAIQHTRDLIAKLKQVKAGLLHDLLTRGLDENGQLRDPDAHPEHFKMVDGYGRVPLDWSFSDLNSVSLKIQDGTHYSPQSKEGPYRYITSKNVRFGHLDLTDCNWISEVEHTQIYARCDVKFDDVLLTKDGANTGNAALNTLKEPFSLLSSVAFIRPNTDYLMSKFVLQYLLSPIGQKRLKDLISGLAITRLTLEKIKALEVPLPTIKEQKRITAILDSHDKRIRAEEAYLHKLEQIKTGLMHDLLTGRVRI